MIKLGITRAPYDLAAGVNFSNGGIPVIDQANGQLYLLTRDNRLVAVNAVEPVADPFASTPAGYSSISSVVPSFPTGSASIAGMWIDGERRISTANPYYDAGNIQRLGHFVNGEWRAVLSATMQGYVAAYMCAVPERWRDQLGDFITGCCGVPILNRTSWGPAAFGVRYAHFEATAGSVPAGIVPVRALLFYNAAHPMIGFNDTLQMGGVVFDRGDEDLCFLGTIGIGPYCYGDKTLDQALHDTASGSTHLCYDPEPGRGDKGGHAYPYVYRIWRYRVADLLAAEHPWDVMPTIEDLPGIVPISTVKTRLLGVASYGDRIVCVQYQAENTSIRGAYPLLHWLQKTPAPVIDPPVIEPIPEPEPAPVPVLSLEDRIAALEQWKQTIGAVSR